MGYIIDGVVRGFVGVPSEEKIFSVGAPVGARGAGADPFGILHDLFNGEFFRRWLTVAGLGQGQQKDAKNSSVEGMHMML